MKLFRGHAVLPLVGQAHAHGVRTYVVIAATWEEARSRIREAEPGAVFVTMPVEAPAAQLCATTSMSELELEDLRSACAWHEKHLHDAAGPSLTVAPTHERPKRP
jgi:hypothetical protein